MEITGSCALAERYFLWECLFSLGSYPYFSRKLPGGGSDQRKRGMNEKMRKNKTNQSELKNYLLLYLVLMFCPWGPFLFNFS